MEPFIAGGTRSALAFEASWDQMQQEVAAFESHGPLDSDVGEAGRGLPRCLQHAITQQREHVESRLVHDALTALAPRDPRRHAYLQLTQESTGFLTAWPSDTHACSPLEFREMFAMYFGLPSPIIHTMQIVGVRFRVPTGAHYTCDAHVEPRVARLPAEVASRLPAGCQVASSKSHQ